MQNRCKASSLSFATRIPVFMYLTDLRENVLIDGIKVLGPELLQSVTGLTIPDFDLLRGLVFSTPLT